MKSQGSTLELRLKLLVLSTGEVIGIPCVAVKCVDIRKNTKMCIRDRDKAACEKLAEILAKKHII